MSVSVKLARECHVNRGCTDHGPKKRQARGVCLLLLESQAIAFLGAPTPFALWRCFLPLPSATPLLLIACSRSGLLISPTFFSAWYAFVEHTETLTFPSLNPSRSAARSCYSTHRHATVCISHCSMNIGYLLKLELPASITTFRRNNQVVDWQIPVAGSLFCRRSESD